MSSAKTTTDHEEIREWVESRGGSPARVKATGRAGAGARTGKRGGDPGILRVDFPGFSGARSLEHISWDEWFDAFEKNNLAFLYQDSVASGQESRFSKLVARPARRTKTATSARRGGAKRTTATRGRASTKRAATKARPAPKKARGAATKRSTTKRAARSGATTKRSKSTASRRGG